MNKQCRLFKIDSNEGINKKGKDAMKNRLIMITTFILAMNGVAFANRTLSDDYRGTSYTTVADDHAIGSTYSIKKNGVSYVIITGVVTTVNTKKNVFVVEDQNSKTSTTVLTDDQTIATISQGKTVTVKLQVGSSMALSVGAGG